MKQDRWRKGNQKIPWKLEFLKNGFVVLKVKNNLAADNWE